MIEDHWAHHILADDITTPITDGKFNGGPTGRLRYKPDDVRNDARDSNERRIDRIRLPRDYRLLVDSVHRTSGWLAGLSAGDLRLAVLLNSLMCRRAARREQGS